MFSTICSFFKGVGNHSNGWLIPPQIPNFLSFMPSGILFVKIRPPPFPPNLHVPLSILAYLKFLPLPIFIMILIPSVQTAFYPLSLPIALFPSHRRRQDNLEGMLAAGGGIFLVEFVSQSPQSAVTAFDFSSSEEYYDRPISSATPFPIPTAAFPSFELEFTSESSPSQFGIESQEVASPPPSYDMIEEQSLVSILYLSYMPLCCIVGLTGNCMVVILIRSNRIFKKLPSSVYLLTLALMSSLFLLSLLSFWVEEGFIKDQSEQHSMFLCKCATFLAHFCDFASVWLIVLVGFERLTLLYRVSFRRSLVNAKRHVFFLLLLSGLANLWILFMAEINEFGGCDIKADYEHIYHSFSLLETIFCMILPSLIIIFSNLFVILRLRAYLKKIPSSPTVSFNTADTVYSTGPRQTVKSVKISKASLCRMGSTCRDSPNSLMVCNNSSRLLNPHEAAVRLKRHSLRYTDLQLTRSLLVITTVFILLNLPNYAYRIGIQFFAISEQTTLMQRLSFAAHVLLYTHHAILFYVYIFNSPQMRKRLVPTALKLLECYCLKPQMNDFSDNLFY